MKYFSSLLFNKFFYYLYHLMLPTKIQKILFDKIKSDLSNCRVFVTKSGDIWFINTEIMQWYFNFSKGNVMYYYVDFFSPFFHIFSIKEQDYNLIIRELAYDLLESNLLENKWRYRKIDKITPLSSKLESIVELTINEKI